MRAFWLVVVLLAGCSEAGSSKNADAGTDASVSMPDAAEPDAHVDAATDAQVPNDEAWREFQAAYGPIETIAGAGLVDNGNDWQPGMEGGSAMTAELSRPHIALADAAGNVYIADKEAHAIRKVTTDGLIHTVAGTGSPGDGADEGIATEVALSNPNGLWVRPDGVFWILDLDNGKIRRVDLDGTIHTVVSGESFGSGRGLWVSPDGSQMYWSAGTALRGWDGTGAYTVATGFVSMGNIDVDADGTIGVADRGASRAYRVTADGTKTVIAGNGTADGGGNGEPAKDTGISELRGIFFHEGGFLVCGHKDHKIWWVDPHGIARLVVGDPVDEPRAVTVAPNGDIVVTEHDNGIIRRLPKL